MFGETVVPQQLRQGKKNEISGSVFKIEAEVLMWEREEFFYCRRKLKQKEECVFMRMIFFGSCIFLKYQRMRNTDNSENKLANPVVKKNILK